MDHLIFDASQNSWLLSIADWFTDLMATPSAQNLFDVLPKILVALVLGAIIGFERWKKHKVAGVRTHTIISTSACLVTLLGVVMAEWATGAAAGKVTDATRLAQGLLGSIGFVGAGVILRRGISTHGVTTAATILLSACVGIAAGFGLFLLPAVTTIVLLSTMLVADRLLPTYETGGLSLEVVCPRDKFAEARKLMGDGAHIDSVRKARGNVEFRAHTRLTTPELDKLLESIVDNDDITSLSVSHSCPSD